jgi:hypothetical protein
MSKPTTLPAPRSSEDLQTHKILDELLVRAPLDIRNRVVLAINAGLEELRQRRVRPREDKQRV